MTTKELTNLKTFGELKKAGYQTKNIKDELRDNLILALKSGDEIFKGILGYSTTVIPEIQRAILSRHHINLLGLRGQAKTRIARQMTALLDEYIPVIAGSEINDDPFNPLSHFGRETIAIKGDDTAIGWMHRDDRFVEKLATPDVTVADLIGDIDPIKAANLKISYSDERAIHFGLIPRSNRCIFVINELPDLQARIQVALFNILQEGDIQIRGFRMRMPLDLQFIFTANPEDYTNRGSIVTPLKDRIQSQIVTHYPKEIGISKTITQQEAKIELVYEGEQEGPVNVAQFLISQAIRSQFINYFPDPERFKRKKEENPYQKIITWFNTNQDLDLLLEEKQQDYERKLTGVDGLSEIVDLYYKKSSTAEKLLLKEFVLYGLAAYSQLNRLALDSSVLFKDLFNSVFNPDSEDGFPMN